MSNRILYFDLVGGAAGDMVLASLIDLGADLETIQTELSRLGLGGVEVRMKEVSPAGLRARQIDVLINGVLADSTTVEGTPSIVTEDEAYTQHSHEHSHDHHHHEHSHDHHHHDHAHGQGHRPYLKIKQLIDSSKLPKEVKELSQDTFLRLAEAESLAHGVPVEQVEFHEVGSDDAIVDIVGSCLALHQLSVSQIVCSPFPLGRGLTRGAHGPIPLPGPATLHLIKGAPTQETPLKSETVTPTGAALLMSFADSFGSVPSMVLRQVGIGAGHKTWPDRPNIVRGMLGTSLQEVAKTQEDWVIEANIDDMSPEHIPGLIDALLSAGAYDAWASSVLMKKGRPGSLVSALARKSILDAVVEVFFKNSSSVGLRYYQVERRRLERKIVTVDTSYGKIRVKVSHRPDGSKHCKPEFEDCQRVATTQNLSLQQVEHEVLRSYFKTLE